MRRLDVDTEEIVRLYVDHGWRTSRIASHFGCSDGVILERLEGAGVVRSRRARLPRAEVTRLYLDERQSLANIGARFGVRHTTVARHLRAWGVEPRSRAGGRSTAARQPCPQSETFRAYLLGLAWGDFAVEVHGVGGNTVSVRSATTRREQVELARLVFSPFGPVTVSAGPPVNVRASLDRSFDFLLDKYEDRVPAWIRSTPAHAAFAAGYVDAEGSFGVYEGRGRFKLDSYDAAVLAWLAGWMASIGVRCRLRCVARKATDRPDGSRYNDDLWRVSVNEAQSLARLIVTIEPFARHERRRETMAEAFANIRRRMRSRDPARTHPLPLDHQPCGPWQDDAG